MTALCIASIARSSEFWRSLSVVLAFVHTFGWADRVKIGGFDWDNGNWPNSGKHGVPLEDIEEFFRGDVAVAPYAKHSPDETRYFGVGRAGGGRPMFVVFTSRIVAGRRLIRPISARYMHAEEANRYGA